jgi:hypothetical protein
MVRPLESTVETQPQLQPAFAEIVSGDFPVVHATHYCTDIKLDHKVDILRLFAKVTTASLFPCGALPGSLRFYGYETDEQTMNVIAGRSERAVTACEAGRSQSPSLPSQQAAASV